MVREFSVLSLPRELVQSLLGDLRADKLSEVPPGPHKDGDWLMVICSNEGQDTEFEKSTVKVKCVLKTQDYLRAVSILTTGADRSSISEENF